jgi:Fe-S-cluster containining protein
VKSPEGNNMTEHKRCQYIDRECGSWCKFLDKEKNCAFVKVEEFILRLQLKDKKVLPFSGEPS